MIARRDEFPDGLPGASGRPPWDPGLPSASGLRRSAARAFAPRPGGGVVARLPAGRLDRHAAVASLFFDIERALRRRASVASRFDRSPALRTTSPRASLEGVEFEIETPRGRWRVVDTLRGTARIDEWTDEGWNGRDLLAVQPSRACPGEYEPIRRSLRVARDGFAFTSVDRLVAEWLEECRGGPPDERDERGRPGS